MSAALHVYLCCVCPQDSCPQGTEESKEQNLLSFWFFFFFFNPAAVQRPLPVSVEWQALSSGGGKPGLRQLWVSFSPELTHHLGPGARPDCSPLGVGSDGQGLIFRSSELHPGHDLIQACVLLPCQHYLCWYYQLCPIWPTSVHLRTHTHFGKVWSAI